MDQEVYMIENIIYRHMQVKLILIPNMLNGHYHLLVLDIPNQKYMHYSSFMSLVYDVNVVGMVSDSIIVSRLDSHFIYSLII